MRSKSEPDREKRKQPCIPFFRGISRRGDQCNYEHQVDNEGKPIPVGPETLQRYDEAVKRSSDNKAKAAPRGGIGITASMIVLDPEEQPDKFAVHVARAPVTDEYVPW